MATIGIIGGTFDPIHFGHLAIAEEARVALNLERVLFIPAAQQPLKHGQQSAPAQQRLEMVCLACASNPAFEVSPIEVERAGVSYTVDTLEQLHAEYAAKLCFILGADALADLPRWHRPADIATLAELVAVKRPRTHVDLAPLFREIPTLRDRVQVLEGPQLELSSTALRQRVASGRSLKYLTPDSVVEYIERHSLYRAEHVFNPAV